MWINLRNVMLSEISQTQKATCYLIPFICHSQGSYLR